MKDSDPQKCEAITRKEQPCKRPPMKGCKYCYAHSIGSMRGVVWWKNPLIHLALGILVTILCFWLGPTRKNQESLLNSQEAAQADRQAKYEDLRSLLIEKNKSVHARLSEKYPYGYVLLGSKDNSCFWIPIKETTAKFQADWKNTRVSVDSTRNHISVVIHDARWHWKYSDTAIDRIGVTLLLKNGAEALSSVRKSNEVNVWVQVVDDNPQVPIVAIGLREWDGIEKQPDQVKGWIEVLPNK